MRRSMMNGTAKTLLLIVSLAFNFGACLALGVQRYGDSDPHSFRGDGRSRRERPWRLPDLSPEQSAAMEASRKAFHGDIRELKDEMAIESETLASLLVEPEPDMAAVLDQAARISDLRGRMQRQMIEHFISIRGVLEPAQLDSFKQMIQRRFAGGGHRGLRGEMRGDRGDREKRWKDGERRRGRDHRPEINQEDDD